MNRGGSSALMNQLDWFRSYKIARSWRCFFPTGWRGMFRYCHFYEHLGGGVSLPRVDISGGFRFAVMHIALLRPALDYT